MRDELMRGIGIRGATLKRENRIWEVGKKRENRASTTGKKIGSIKAWEPC
jgi:hypothetical protein